MTTALIDLLSMFPSMTPEQATKLIESGVDVNSLIQNVQSNYNINDAGNNINANGISMDYSFNGPALNMMQKNFTGTSNLLSPYAYIHKKRTEQFGGNIMSPHLYYESFSDAKEIPKTSVSLDDIKKNYYKF